jgi:peptidoglycan-associated lipoprotein
MRITTKTTLLIMMLLGLTLAGCDSTKKKKTMTDDPSMGESMSDEDYAKRDLVVNGDSDSGKAGAIRTVYFNFNSSSLSDSTRSALQANADFLKANTGVEIQIEGHADERGGVQYNLALGEQRGATVKRYLVSMGVSSSRITTISFGKERPIAFGHSENSWSRNRRANFVVTAK